MAAKNLLYKSLINVRNITKEVFSLDDGVDKSNKYVAKIGKSVNQNTNLKRKSILSDSILYRRKVESVRRKKQEGIIELSKVGSVLRAPGRALIDTGQGILSRIMNVAGTIMAGWLVYNLPTIAGMAQELTARVVRLTQILGTFLPNIRSGFSSLGDLIGAYGQNFISLDFNDSQGRVEKSMIDLRNSFSGMSDSFDEVLTLITTPLTQGIASGQDIAPFGTDYSQRGSGTGQKLQPIHKQALDIIAGPESGGNYNAMNQGTDSQGRILGSGDSKKIIGKALTDMTIGEVMDRQDESKYPRGARPDRGIHAAGKYQIIGSTMKEAVKLSGLSKSDKFSPENQDLLGIAVLKSQGPGAWTKYSRYTKEEIDIMYKAKNTPLGTAPTQPPSAKPAPSSKPPVSNLQLIPQTGKGGFIQGGSGSSGDATYATHFHIDLKTPNYTSEGLARIREVAFHAVKAMQARGSYVTFGNIPGYPVASKNESTLRSQILQEQQGHDDRSSPGVDLQEHNSNIQRTFPSQPGSKTKFPFAVGAVYWRGGYGREAEIIGSGGVTVSHGAPGSSASESQPAPKPTPAQIQAKPKPPVFENISKPQEQESYVVPFIYPQQQTPQAAPPSIFTQPQSFGVDSSLNSFIDKKILLDLAYT